MPNLLDELARRNAAAEAGGGLERRRREKQAGKLSARERIDLLLDEGSFEETGKFVASRATDFGMADQRIPGDGFITGHGRIHGRIVFVFAQDFTVFGGSLSEANAAKIVAIMDTAMRVGAPVIGLNDSGGARIQEGVVSLAGYTDIFLRNTLASGVIPQISAILGPCAGGAVYSPAITDFTLMTDRPATCSSPAPTSSRPSPTKTSPMIPPRRRRHPQRNLRRRPLHGRRRRQLPRHHPRAPHLPPRPTTSTFRRARPAPTTPPAPTPPSTPSSPPNPTSPTTSRRHHEHIVDDAYLFEVHEHFARNIVVGFARMNGRPVGIVANQPAFLAGVLDIDASVKAARFVRFCDAFNIPLITFEDVPGFLPGVQQEHGGIIRHGAKLLYAFAEATVPKLTVITRKAYGGAYCVMSSKHLRTDLNLAWPTAEIAVMGPEGAVNIVYKREFDRLSAPPKPSGPRAKPFTEERESWPSSPTSAKKRSKSSATRFANPYVAAERGYIDAVIRPSETRRRLNQALDMLATKRDKNPPKKHGNIPL